jgi:hypothetical protein
MKKNPSRVWISNRLITPEEFSIHNSQRILCRIEKNDDFGSRSRRSWNLYKIVSYEKIEDFSKYQKYNRLKKKGSEMSYFDHIDYIVVEDFISKQTLY